MQMTDQEFWDACYLAALPGCIDVVLRNPSGNSPLPAIGAVAIANASLTERHRHAVVTWHVMRVCPDGDEILEHEAASLEDAKMVHNLLGQLHRRNYIVRTHKGVRVV